MGILADDGELDAFPDASEESLVRTMQS